MRTSSQAYRLDDCEDQFVHLTNNAVQKHSESYGKYEDGNIIGFDKFQEVIDKHCKRHKKKSVSVAHELIPDMKFLVIKTIESVKNKIN